jgi:four helix bundle protein
MNNGIWFMIENKNKIKYFTDLNAWKYGHELVISVYDITNKFPKKEMFVLTNQIRRASVSVTSNIAEGFSRNSFKEKVQFYSMAQGSVTEIQNQLIIARDIKYINVDEFDKIFDCTITVHKIINGLIKSSKIRTSHP